MNLCASGEETAVLVQAGNENILINPTLRGHLLRDAIYDAKGLEPSAITRVICLKSDPQHTLDVPIMKNAQLYLPKRTLEAEKQSTENGPRHLAFNAWEKTPEMPIEFIEIGSSSVCVFNSGGKKIAVSSDHCDERALIDMGVHVSIMGADTRILQ